MRKLFPLFTLLILVSFLPLVKANPDIETLWCDSYVSNRLGWTHAGAIPYLGDTDGSWISTKVDVQTEGDFGFSDLSSAGTIITVTLYLECKADDAPADDGFNVYVFDGSSWSQEGGTIQPPQTTYQYVQLALTTKLDTSDKVNAAQVYFEYVKSKGADDLWIRRAYLYIDYTPTPQGQVYTREVSQSLSWTGTSYRTWILTRDFTQGITLASDSLRSWDTHRLLTQSTTLATVASRTWDLSRTLSQGISLSISTYAQHLEYIFRSLTLGLNLATDSVRTWDLSRLLNQGLTITSDSLRSWTLSRTLSQGLSFLSSAIGQITTGAEQFLRTLTMSLSLTTDSIRSWTLLKTITQGITFTGNAMGRKFLGGLIKRALTLSIILSSNIDLTRTIIKEFNIPLVMLLLFSIVFTVLYVIKEETIWVGFTAGTSWAATAFIILRENPDYWPYALFFSALSLVLYWLTIVEVIELKEVPWM